MHKRLLACFFVALGLPLLAAASYGQTVISSVPITIQEPGKYILQSNLTASSSNTFAILVGASNVEIDLNGYTLRSPGATTTPYGIVVTNNSGKSSPQEVVIRNGTLSNFFGGILLQDSSAVTVENVRLTDSGGPQGISVVSCTATIIRNCQIVKTEKRNPLNGLDYGIEIIGSIGTQVIGTQVVGLNSEPFGEGIRTSSSSGNYFESDYIITCDIGMFLESADDKYRSITTTNCPIPISGKGTSVDCTSN